MNKLLQQLIKDLSAEQTKLKSQRKTGTLTKSYSWYDRDIPANIKASWSAANQVRANKPRITAALNLSHELRGSEYRHGLPDSDYDYYNCYKVALRELREEFAEESVE